MNLVTLTATFFDGSTWDNVTVEITTTDEETAIELLKKEIKCITLRNTTKKDFELAGISLEEHSMWVNRDWLLACSALESWVAYDIEHITLPLIKYV